ncbi:MAG: hemolysin family protein, partial [bacterium]
LEDIVAVFGESGYSRIPVYHETLDNVLGVIYGKDVLVALREGRKATAKDLMRSPVFVPETQPLNEVLDLMRNKGVHLLFVHDEFGGTAGVLAMEDVLEEIVGEIYDEFDVRAAGVEWIEPDVAMIDARMSVELVNKALGTGLPVDEGYETLGGYLFHRLGRPGKVGETLRHDGYEYRFERVIGRRILRVRATRLVAAKPGHEGAE